MLNGCSLEITATPCCLLLFLQTRLLCRVVKGDDERWLQEEVVISQGKASAELVPLADPLIMSVLECALNSKIPRPPLWERVFDLAIGKIGSYRPLQPSLTGPRVLVSGHSALSRGCH